MSLNCPFTAIGLTETWMNNKSSIFNLSGYSFYQAPRLNGRGGGVALFIDSTFTVRILDHVQFQTNDVESLFIEIVRSRQKNVILGVVYRKPSSNSTDFTDEFDRVMQTICTSNTSNYVMGDFNLNLLEFISDFLNGLFSLGLYPLINKPTRIFNNSATLLDNIFTNSIKQNAFSGICITDISDHFPVFHISPVCKNIKYVEYKSFFRDITASSITSLITDLGEIDWSNVLLSDNVDESYNTFLDCLILLCDKNMPLKEKRSNCRHIIKKPWITFAILNSIRKKNNLYKKYNSNPLSEN